MELLKKIGTFEKCSILFKSDPACALQADMEGDPLKRIKIETNAGIR